MRSPRSIMKVYAAEDFAAAVFVTVLGAYADNFGHVFEFGHDSSARLGLRERKVDRLFFFGHLDAFDFFQLFDSALHLLGFGRLVAEAIDEDFQLLDAVALVAVGGLRVAPCAAFFEARNLS
jgi:hypothetical protein